MATLLIASAGGALVSVSSQNSRTLQEPSERAGQMAPVSPQNSRVAEHPLQLLRQLPEGQRDASSSCLKLRVCETMGKSC